MARPKLEHITSKEYTWSLMLMYAIYLGIAMSTTIHSLGWYLIMCVGLFLGLGKIQKHFLMWLNERRCEAVEVNPEISPDDDSNEE